MSITTVSDRDLFWLVVIHVVFVASSVLLALSDRISASSGQHAPSAEPVAAPVPATAAKGGGKTHA
jgi:hypothetical protein